MEDEKKQVESEIIKNASDCVTESVPFCPDDVSQIKMRFNNDVTPSKPQLTEGEEDLRNKNVGKELEKFNPKDRGYCWVVVIAMMLINIMTAGYVKSFGVTYTALLDYHPSTTALIGGLLLSFLAGSRSILAPVVSVIVAKIGSRAAMLIGATGIFLGLFLSFFNTSIIFLVITLGAMMGSSICIIDTAQVIVVSQFFHKKIAVANGIRVTGNPLGGMLYPLLLNLLYGIYGFKLSLLIQTGILCHLFVLILIIRPYKQHEQAQRYYMKQYLKDNKITEEGLVYNNSFINKFDQPSKGKKKGLDFTYLKNPSYLILLLVTASAATAMPCFLYFIPAYGRHIGISPINYTLLVSVQSITDAAFRPLIGFISSKKYLSTRNTMVVAMVIGGSGCLLTALAGSLWSIMITCVLFSVGSAAYYALLNVVLHELFGEESIGTTFGFARMMQGVLNFIFPPILGWTIDHTGSFTTAFLVNGCGFILAAVFLILQQFVHKLMNKKIDNSESKEKC